MAQEDNLLGITLEKDTVMTDHVTSAYDLFETVGSLEKTGVWIAIGPMEFLLARAGGENTEFKKAAQAKFKPFELALANDTMDEKLAQKLVIEVMCTTVLLGWRNVYDRDKNELPFTKENAIKLLTDLPALFEKLQAEAQRIGNFRNKGNETVAKN